MSSTAEGNSGTDYCDDGTPSINASGATGSSGTGLETGSNPLLDQKPSSGASSHHPLIISSSARTETTNNNDDDDDDGYYSLQHPSHTVLEEEDYAPRTPPTPRSNDCGDGDDDTPMKQVVYAAGGSPLVEGGLYQKMTDVGFTCIEAVYELSLMNPRDVYESFREIINLLDATRLVRYAKELIKQHKARFRRQRNRRNNGRDPSFNTDVSSITNSQSSRRSNDASRRGRTYGRNDDPFDAGDISSITNSTSQLSLQVPVNDDSTFPVEFGRVSFRNNTKDLHVRSYRIVEGLTTAEILKQDRDPLALQVDSIIPAGMHRLMREEVPRGSSYFFAAFKPSTGAWDLVFLGNNVLIRPDNGTDGQVPLEIPQGATLGPPSPPPTTTSISLLGFNDTDQYMSQESSAISGQSRQDGSSSHDDSVELESVGSLGGGSGGDDELHEPTNHPNVTFPSELALAMAYYDPSSWHGLTAEESNHVESLNDNHPAKKKKKKKKNRGRRRRRNAKRKAKPEDLIRCAAPFCKSRNLQKHKYCFPKKERSKENPTCQKCIHQLEPTPKNLCTVCGKQKKKHGFCLHCYRSQRFHTFTMGS